MIIGIPNDCVRQPLAAATPDTVAKLVKLGYDVRVEAGAGAAASYFDAAFEAAGATVVNRESALDADIVLALDTPAAADLDHMHAGSVLICRMNPFGQPDIADDFAKRKITALAMDAIPRLSRAQSMDVRSSMMNIGGYRAVIEAASAFGRTFGGQVTAAGKTKPARVYVIGVGVAGLAAIGQAASMGAEVFATDVRADVADQVESLGATFVEIPVKQESANGYARPLTEEEQAQVLQVYADQAAKSDIVITTAAVPGRAAPLLLSEEAVAGMQPGSVIVDMGASSLGGNCALSRPDARVLTENGVIILGPTDLPATMPAQASQLYGQNIVNFLKLCTPAKDGKLELNQEDDVVRGVTVALDGTSTWPPPEISVSAPSQKTASEAGGAKGEPDADASGNVDAALKGGEAKMGQVAQASPVRKYWWKVLAAAVLAALVLLAPASMTVHFTVFALACVVGFYVITAVEHKLHTPLMSETNAISGIIIVGAILQMALQGNVLVSILSFIAASIAAINIFGGFYVTARMLKMFEGSSE
ncbi:MAG: Re/Si-specific NAD(P)(+) transhydrogenase subunit alpha [Eggerthellaceae bacterium]|nr:Re/Si-specific NAD(P)(+) transhydrogenase subunit alpha [Eggerthellaceae bacterium]